MHIHSLAPAPLLGQSITQGRRPERTAKGERAAHRGVNLMLLYLCTCTYFLIRLKVVS